MPPYFLPYLGYLQLINNSDLFIIFDMVNFPDKGWVNRNRIYNLSKKKTNNFLTIPLFKRKQFSKIIDIKIDNTKNWQGDILNKLSIYEKKAPFFLETKNLILKIFDSNFDNLSDFVSFSLIEICNYLKIETQILRQSQIKNIRNLNCKEPGDWSLQISKIVGASSYINPYSGYKIFNEEEFRLNNINLKFLISNLPFYKQFRDKEFMNSLSIIDYLMWIEKNNLEKFIDLEYKIFSLSDIKSLIEN